MKRTVLILSIIVGIIAVASILFVIYRNCLVELKEHIPENLDNRWVYISGSEKHKGYDSVYYDKTRITYELFDESEWLSVWVKEYPTLENGAWNILLYVVGCKQWSLKIERLMSYDLEGRIIYDKKAIYDKKEDEFELRSIKKYYIPSAEEFLKNRIDVDSYNFKTNEVSYMKNGVLTSGDYSVVLDSLLKENRDKADMFKRSVARKAGHFLVSGMDVGSRFEATPDTYNELLISTICNCPEAQKLMNK
jgi:hypothetical protein